MNFVMLAQFWSKKLISVMAETVQKPMNLNHFFGRVHKWHPVPKNGFCDVGTIVVKKTNFCYG